VILKRYRYNLEKRDELIEFLKSEKGIQQLKNTEGFISFEYYETMCLSILDSEEIYTIVTLQKWRSIDNYEENLKKNNIDEIFEFIETLILNYNPIN
jgi:heme-degrading monooxygenase HmoA